ncbi:MULTISPECIES: glycerophosphodiester phosphodiesterase family protein [Rufibacter]|uniref:Glycerophosphoryl diester phosphodiesterase n=1 Tax=Rufibacter quisquiliarum TaxID=1549639 RepID=A0A839GP64_9BACT|nr:MULTISPECIES: glycerophosphodiester phosphodiesterase family protein [Rufibacter]MBA9076697.1 glycerophosphoryl diester phosphodiesterase [Rufibacter quisquiliarum]
MRLTQFTVVPALLLLLSCSPSQQMHAPVPRNPLDTILKEFHSPQGKQVLVVAHRGDWRNAPENSLQAIQNAIDMGVDILEIDIQKTQDGHLVLLHDQTLDRTTNGKGKVADHTLAQVKKLYLKGGHGVVTEHRVPTLQEALLLMKGKVMVNLDKGYDYFREAYAVLEATGTRQQTILKSGHPYGKVARENGEVLQKVPFMPVVWLEKKETRQIMADYQRELKPAAFEIVFKTDTSAVLQEFQAIKKGGARVWVNTLWPSLNARHHDDLAVEGQKPDESWGWVLEKGANIIQTDRPRELLAYLRRRGLHR